MIAFDLTLRETLAERNIPFDDDRIARAALYAAYLLDENQKMNLTAIVDEREIAVKHFADSLTLLDYVDIRQGASVIDVGTGAGFPGMVLRIARPDIRLTLLDSLNKRLLFLEEVCSELGIDDVTLIHSRAEDGSRTELRDSFDYAVSRAVASLNVLCEYDLPYVKVGGSFIAMKGKDAQAEIGGAESAVKELCGEIKAVHSFELGAAGERCIIEIEKTAPTPGRYPRKSKAIKNKPL